jgi:hypothetical protein
MEWAALTSWLRRGGIRQQQEAGNRIRPPHPEPLPARGDRSSVSIVTLRGILAVTTVARRPVA